MSNVQCRRNDEADDAVSKKDFLKCIGTCKKEARESKHFLRMAARAVPQLKSEARAVARSQGHCT
jgi:hypothetical protein